MLGPEYRWKTVVYADAPDRSAASSRGALPQGARRSLAGRRGSVARRLRSVAERPAQGLRRPRRRRHLLRRRARGARLRAEAGGPAVSRAQRRAVAQLQRRRRARAARRGRRRRRRAWSSIRRRPTSPWSTRRAPSLCGRTALAVESRDDRRPHRASRRLAASTPSRAGELHAPARRPSRPLHGQRLSRAVHAARHQDHRQHRRAAHADDGSARSSAHYSQPLGVAVRDVNKRSQQLHGRADPEDARRRDRRPAGHLAKGHRRGGRLPRRLGIARRRLQDDQRLGAVRLQPASRRRSWSTLLRAAYKDFRFAADFVGSLALAGADGTVGTAWKAAWPSATCAPRPARCRASPAWPATPARRATRRWPSPSS